MDPRTHSTRALARRLADLIFEAVEWSGAYRDYIDLIRRASPVVAELDSRGEDYVGEFHDWVAQRVRELELGAVR